MGRVTNNQDYYELMVSRLPSNMREVWEGSWDIPEEEEQDETDRKDEARAVEDTPQGEG